MTKTALIVDDSPLARHVLGKLLAEHDIAADTAPSAEEALDYLKQRRPDVVFMDHLMPGMDGFEALEAIKANPATATIPIMMYTSQEGEVYVGQARALGAFGVLPKDLKPIEVARVLRALRLIPGEPQPIGTAASPEQARPARGPEQAPSPESHAEAADTLRVKALLEELFHQQRSALRAEIREGYERALASTQAHGESVQPSPVPIARAPIRVAAFVLAVLTVALAYLYFNAVELLDEANRRSAELVSRNAALGMLSPATQPAAPAATPDPLLGALEWAVNVSGRYGFLDVPLDDERAELMSRLIGYLEEAGYAGVVAIEVHVGRFCMNSAADGAWRLAPADDLAQNCEQLGWSATEAVSLGRRQSLAFANTLATATTSGRIEIRTLSLGFDAPVVAYPPTTDYVTAGEWNAIAALNQRIDVRLVADGSAF